MHMMQVRASAAHGLFHLAQRVDSMLNELDLVDLHQISVHLVNECFTHGRGSTSCQDQRVEAGFHTILDQLSGRVSEMPDLPSWQYHYRQGLAMELTGKLRQGLALIQAYRELPEQLSVEIPPPLHTAEGVIGHHPDNQNWLERACDWEPGNGPWG